MKTKLFNFLIDALFFFGVLVIIGAVGSMDFHQLAEISYPFINVVLTLMVGILMVLPAVFREVLNEK